MSFCLQSPPGAAGLGFYYSGLIASHFVKAREASDALESRKMHNNK